MNDPAVKPAPPPDAVLIRLVREAANLSAADVARKAGISSVRLTQIENGYETRAGHVKPVRARPGTYAHIAHALGITAERLEGEGVRPEAVPILREIERQEEADAEHAGEPGTPDTPDTPESTAPGPAAIASAKAVLALMGPAEEQVRAEIARARMRHGRDGLPGSLVFPADDREARLWDLEALPEDERVGYIAFLRTKAAEEEAAIAGRESRPGRPRRVQ